MNDVLGGLRGYSSTLNFSIEQLEDEIVEERQAIIQEWYHKGILTTKDLLLAINCIEVDCKDQSRCCGFELCQNALHFEIPPLVNDLGKDAIKFIGSVDRQISFWFYFTNTFTYHKYRRRGNNDAYVYIETTPNENGMYDGWIFNAPFVKTISVIGVFRDPRMLEMYNCCEKSHILNLGALSSEIKKRLTERKLRYYRQLIPPVHPNDGIPQ